MHERLLNSHSINLDIVGAYQLFCARPHCKCVGRLQWERRGNAKKAKKVKKVEKVKNATS